MFEHESEAMSLCLSLLSSVSLYTYVCARARVCRWCFLASSCLLKHTSFFFILQQQSVGMELTIWRCFLVCSFDSWGSNVSREMHVRAACRPCLSFSFSCLSFLLRPTIRSFTRSRSDNKNRSFYAGWSNYIYICMYVHVCISPLPFLFSWWPAQFVCVCECVQRVSRTPRERENEAERTDRTGSSSLNRTDTHTHILLFFSQHTLRVSDSQSSVNSSLLLLF